MSAFRLAAAILGMSAVIACGVERGSAATSQDDRKPQSRAAQEASFRRTVDRAETASVITGDLSYYTGRHVDYECDVETIVRPGVILGQCGSEAEPIDLFVRLPTLRLHVGDRLQVLGIMESPVTWTDVLGHSVYFAFLRAVFVDPLR